MTIQQIKNKIAKYQEVQKRNHPDSAKWQEASERLQPLFQLMANAS